jgi:hypothetical protein
MPNKPPQFWSDERLEQAALSEAARHGASQRDLEVLKAQFKKAEDNKSKAEDIPEDTGSQTSHFRHRE